MLLRPVLGCVNSSIWIDQHIDIVPTYHLDGLYEIPRDISYNLTVIILVPFFLLRVGLRNPERHVSQYWWILGVRLECRYLSRGELGEKPRIV